MSGPEFWSEWQERGIVHQATADDLGRWIAERVGSAEGLSCYCGFDPTADSLHIGSLMPVLGLLRLKRVGVRPIALVGGATGMIGDPSGKSAERSLQDSQSLAHNTAALGRQLEELLEGKKGVDFDLLDNADWLGPVRLLDFLRDVGKHFSVNRMVAKESVRARLEDRDHGISYTEFSYMLLQSYDFLHLFETRGCRMQVGGSDQWGNITAGIDLIRHKVHGAEVAGMTFPLITTAAGAKFGKSERGNLWLDAKKTHPYFLFKYLFDVQDADVVRFLRYFTFLPLEEIQGLERRTEDAPQERAAQRALAREVTALVHGRSIAEACAGLEAAMHADDVEQFERHADRLGLLSAAGAGDSADEAVLPVAHRPRRELEGEGVRAVDLAVAVGLYASKSEVRREIAGPQSGFRVGGQPVRDPEERITAQTLGGRRVLQLKRGKKNKRMVVFHD